MTDNEDRNLVLLAIVTAVLTLAVIGTMALLGRW
jgi:hypothetical protein